MDGPVLAAGLWDHMPHLPEPKPTPGEQSIATPAQTVVHAACRGELDRADADVNSRPAQHTRGHDEATTPNRNKLL